MSDQTLPSLSPPEDGINHEAARLELGNRLHENATHVGSVVLSDHQETAAELKHGFRRLENGRFYLPVKYGGFETDIPPSAFTNVASEGTPFISLPATAIDTLPLGTYTMATALREGFVARNTMTIHEYAIDDKNVGKYLTTVDTQERPGTNQLFVDTVNADGSWELRSSPRSPKLIGTKDVEPVSFIDRIYSTRAHHVRGTMQLFERVGYPMVTDAGGNVAGIISPNTLVKVVGEWGVNIALISECDEYGQIRMENFVGAFANKQKPSFPVGIGDIDHYIHDSQDDDHIAGVLAAGQGALDMLQPIAEGALALKDRGELVMVGLDLDFISALIRQAFVDAFNGKTDKIVETLDEFYEALAEKVGHESEAGAFSAVVLKGFLKTGAKVGWDQEQLNAVEALIPLPAAA